MHLMARGAAAEAALTFSLVSSVHSIDRRELAELLSPAAGSGELGPRARRFFSRFGAVYSWTAFGDPLFRERLVRLAGAAVEVFPFFRGGAQGGDHAANYYLRCVGEPPLAHPLRLPAPGPPEALAWAERYWREQGLCGSPVLVIQPGSGSPRKQWECGGFEEAARWWRGETGGRVVVVLGPAEEERGFRWPPVAGSLLLRGLSIPRLAALLRLATLYLGNDSGVSHLAGAVGAWGAVVFGPTDPGTWRPLGGRLEVIRSERFRARCPEAPSITLEEVSPQDVIRALGRAWTARCAP
jgi:hypothetical protein